MGLITKWIKAVCTQKLKNIIENCIEVDLNKRFNCCDILNDIQSKNHVQVFVPAEMAKLFRSL